MRWLLVIATLLGLQTAEAKPTSPPLTAMLSLSTPIGTQAPVLKVVLTNQTSQDLVLASVEKHVCWIGLYFTGRLLKADRSEVARLKPCKAAGTKTFSLAGNTTFTIEVPVDLLFRTIPRGTYELDLRFDSAVASARDPALAIQAESRAASLRFTIAKLVKTFTAKKGTPVAFAKRVKLELVGHGHEHLEAGSGTSPLLVAARLLTSGKATELSATVYDKRPFKLGRHVFSLVEYQYDEYMKLDYWGTIDVGE